MHKPRNAKDVYTLSYAGFTVPLVKAVQEQQEMINALQKQNEELTKELKVLKELMEKKLK